MTGPGHLPLLDGLRARVTPSVGSWLANAVQLGFLGGVPIDDQIDHALGFVFCAEAALGGIPRSTLDLGSGGGLPGLILASCWPECHLVLLDSNDRRTAFLASAVADLFPTAGIEIIRSRAEEFGRDQHRRASFELVTARSFGSPAVTSECGAPMLATGGFMVVSEPPESVSTRWPEAGLTQLGLAVQRLVRFDGRFSYQVLTKDGPTPDRYPRRVGVPGKRPLF